jgi:hypothetical protein
VAIAAQHSNRPCPPHGPGVPAAERAARARRRGGPGGGAGPAAGRARRRGGPGGGAGPAAGRARDVPGPSRATRRRPRRPGACISWKTCRPRCDFPQTGGAACIGWKIGAAISNFPRCACCGTIHSAPGVGEETRSGAPHCPGAGWRVTSRGARRSGSGGASTAGAGIGIIHSTDSAVDHCRKPTAAPGPHQRRGRSIARAPSPAIVCLPTRVVVERRSSTERGAVISIVERARATRQREKAPETPPACHQRWQLRPGLIGLGVGQRQNPAVDDHAPRDR